MLRFLSDDDIGNEILKLVIGEEATCIDIQRCFVVREVMVINGDRNIGFEIVGIFYEFVAKLIVEATSWCIGTRRSIVFLGLFIFARLGV